MKLLSFDTSTSDLHICLANQGQVVSSQVVKAHPEDRQYAGSLLIPAIEALLEKTGWGKAELEGLVVGIGPGSFTGIRIAVVTARTIAQALNLPLIGISVLEVYVFQRALSTGVILRAGRAGCFAAAYDVISIGQPTEDTSSKQEMVKQLELRCTSAPSYTNGQELCTVLKNAPRWLVEASLLPVLGKTQVEIEMLPVINNIAIVQAQLAFNRLSLARASGSKHGAVSPFSNPLLAAFPYEHVRPLYLQGASVTQKRHN